MSLTFGDGPLAGHVTTNFEMQGPAHKMMFMAYPRRMRAVIGERIVLDSRAGRMLHETGALPVLYFPDGDFDQSTIEGSDTTTECPYRGAATWWSLSFDSHSVSDAIWAYRDPKPGHEWLRGYRALRWDAVEAWFCEDERLFGHLKDPFHRVDAFEGSQQVTVRAGDLLIASSVRPKLLFETGLPMRVYIPGADVLPGLLSPSQTRSVCPYKGEASYWTLRAGAHTIEDAAWSYETPLPEALKVQGHLCFETGDMEIALGEPEDRLRNDPSA